MSDFENEIIGNFKPVYEKLLKYGFSEIGGVLVYEKDILGGQFRLRVKIDDKGTETDLFDTEFNEPYVLYRINDAVGEFNGKVKSAVTEVLDDIKTNCFDNAKFGSAVAIAVTEYVKTTYGDEPEFLWEKFPDYAVFRRKDNRKWYAVVGSVNALKLGIDENKVVSLLLLRGDPQAVNGKTVFTGWHMNKKSWISMILDERSETGELFSRIDESYRLTAKKK